MRKKDQKSLRFLREKNFKGNKIKGNFGKLKKQRQKEKIKKMEDLKK